MNEGAGEEGFGPPDAAVARAGRSAGTACSRRPARRSSRRRSGGARAADADSARAAAGPTSIRSSVSTTRSKALRSRLLAVPALRTRYLGYVRDIAEKWLDWNKLDPIVRAPSGADRRGRQARRRKLYSTEAFSADVRGSDDSLQRFVEKRREFLLKPRARGQALASAATPTGAVVERIISVCGSVTDSGVVVRPCRMSSSSRTVPSPISRIGCAIVVSGGSM